MWGSRGSFPPPQLLQGVNRGCCVAKKGDCSHAYKNTSIARCVGAPHPAVHGLACPQPPPRWAPGCCALPGPGLWGLGHGRAEALGQLQGVPVRPEPWGAELRAAPHPAHTHTHACARCCVPAASLLRSPSCPSGLQVSGEPQQLLLAVDGFQVLQVGPGGDGAPHAQGLLRACGGELGSEPGSLSPLHHPPLGSCTPCGRTQGSCPITSRLVFGSPSTPYCPAHRNPLNFFPPILPDPLHHL